MKTTTDIEIRYPDCDMMQVVHHAVYPYWYEIARMDFLSAMELPFSATHVVGIDPAMVNLNLSYHRSLTYPGSARIQTTLVSYAPKKLELHYEVFDADGNLCASATSFHIWVQNGKSLDMEQNYPEFYRKVEAAYET